MLTELQAWEELFKGFAKPMTHHRRGYSGHDGWAIICGQPKECLCDGIGELCVSGQISEGTFLRMGDLIRRYGKLYRTTRQDDMFFWPRTQEGAWDRAKFCAIMIEQRYKDLFKWHGLGEVPFKDITHMWYI